MQNRQNVNPATRAQPPVHGNYAQGAAPAAAAAAPGIPIRPLRDIHIHMPVQRNQIDPLLINHQVIYSNIGPNPGPCNICLTQRQPQNIYLRHCISRCPGVVLPYHLYFATSDFVAPNDIRPQVLYQLGANYYSSVPGGYHLVQPVVVGVFNPPPRANPVVAGNAPANGSISGTSQNSNASAQSRRTNASGGRTPQHRIRVTQQRRFRNLHPKPTRKL